MTVNLVKPSCAAHQRRLSGAHRPRGLLHRTVLAGILLLAFAPLLLRAEPTQNPYRIDATLLLLTALRARKHAPPQLHSLLDSPEL